MYEEITEFVKSVGFPIAACIIVYVDLRGQIVKLRESVDKLISK